MSAAAKKPEIDWDGIKALWRTGSLSNVAIAKQYGVTDGGIVRKAKREGWVRDLADQVKKKVREQLVRGDAQTVRGSDSRGGKTAPALTDEEIVEAAAESPVLVVRGHRSDLTRAQNICGLLFAQLSDAALNRGEIEADICDEMDPEIAAASGVARQALIARKQRMLRAIELPTHAATIRDLSNAMKNFQGLERTAWGLNEQTDAPDDYEKQLKALDQMEVPELPALPHSPAALK